MSTRRRKQPAEKQPSSTEHALPLLKKPLEQIGKQINVPGSFWSGRMSADERSTLYKCTVRDFTHTHKFPGEQAPRAAFQLQEMGVTGTGSTEPGDSSGEIFWMPYPTFLGFFYQTFPEMMPQPSNKQGGSGESVAQRAGEDNAADGAGNGASKDETVQKPDVLPEYPHLRLSKAVVMKHFTIVSDDLVMMGPHSGQYKATFEGSRDRTPKL